MYKKGDYVNYGANGVCKIEEITKEPFDGAPKNGTYYVLFVVNTGSKMYVPIERGDSIMRKIMNRDEAETLIKSITDITPLVIDEQKKAENVYKEIIRSNDCVELIRLIKYIHFKKEERMEQNKQITTTDRKYMKIAEDALYLELGTVLGIKKCDVLPFILKEVK